MDPANGYEEHAREFLAARSYTIGTGITRQWARSLPTEAAVLELGCGGGYPVTHALVDAGLNVWAVDASPTLLGKFRQRFPRIPTRCEAVQRSSFFGRTFDAVIAIGLLFLLSEADQMALIRRVATVLRSGGRFLFTAPVETGTWTDIITGRKSCSLGGERYEQALRDAGFALVATCIDEGRNNHYEAARVIARPT